MPKCAHVDVHTMAFPTSRLTLWVMFANYPNHGDAAGSGGIHRLNDLWQAAHCTVDAEHRIRQTEIVLHMSRVCASFIKASTLHSPWQQQQQRSQRQAAAAVLATQQKPPSFAAHGSTPDITRVQRAGSTGTQRKHNLAAAHTIPARPIHLHVDNQKRLLHVGRWRWNRRSKQQGFGKNCRCDCGLLFCPVTARP